MIAGQNYARTPSELIFVSAKVSGASNRFYLYLAEKAMHMLEGVDFTREFLCWRGRDFDELYECRVAAISGETVRIEFELDWLDVSAEIAADIAFCLSEAMAIAKQTDINNTTAAVREEGLLRRKYRLLCGVWQFSAMGIVPAENAGLGDLCNTQDSGSFVAVRTIEEGGFELEFGKMGYSFSAQDASWLQEKLLEASQQQPNQHPRVGLLGSVRKVGERRSGKAKNGEEAEFTCCK